MKRLIVCCDGTWNTPDQEDNGVPSPTNVVKIHNAIADEDGSSVKQLKYYHPGLGTEGGKISSFAGGAFGKGIRRHICSAYHWLGNNFEEGDEVFLFGFSRGAFTVRSLGGLLGRGLLQLKGLDSDEAWKRVHTAYDEGYREKDAQQSDWAKSNWEFFNEGKAVGIRFIGVWDTVGALGIPDDLELLNLLDQKKKWQFHNTDLGKNVKTARHAMALDEIRSSFCVTRWSNASQHKDTEELWFPGVHSDVGGGYSETDLSNGALLWMMEESENAKLKFRDGVKDSIKQNPQGVMHNSYKGAFAKLRSRPRNIDAVIADNQKSFHPNVLKRQAASPIDYPPYHPTKILDVDEKCTRQIYAGERWNATGIYLEAGHEYKFSSTGEWQDGKDTCSWKGTQDDKWTFGDLVRFGSSVWGSTETIFKKATGNESTDFLFTKRVESMKWFVMVGAIANDAGSTNEVKNDGSPLPHQYVDLTQHVNKALKVKHSGYLYCFPNDVWSKYDNNHGSVTLTIERIA